MGYLKTIENNTTWKCPKTATYEIICVASGTPDDEIANNPTSFGEYCTAYGTWPGSSNSYNGYTFNSYGDIFSGAAGTNHKTIGYGAGVVNGSLLGKLNIAISDIKKDTEVICTVGASVISANQSSNPGVIVIKEIGEVSESNIIDNPTEKKEFTINLYRYDELYQSLKIKEGIPLVLPVLPIYKDDEYTGDAQNVGYTLSLGAEKVYNANQVIYPMADMNLYAGYSYKFVTTDNSVGTCIATAPGMCHLNVRGQEGSSGTVTLMVNGSARDNPCYVNKGDTISYVINGSGLSVSVTYPVIRINSWRSKL